jgi:hypothetical protein
LTIIAFKMPGGVFNKFEGRIMADDNDDDRIQDSPDDILEPIDDIFNPETDEEKLEGDYDSPATPPVRNPHHIPPDHPVEDTDIEPDELYQEGIGEASGVDDSEELPKDRPEPLEPEN